MRRLVIASAIAALSCAQLRAQTFLEGTVTDSESGEVLPFVNIAVQGTAVGTISDVNGEFSLAVPDAMSGLEVSFSSVGYAPASRKISQIAGMHAAVEMSPADIGIAEVVVAGKSEAGRKAVKQALEALESEYICKPYSYSGKYQSRRISGGACLAADYDFCAYDSQGYSRRPGSSAFAALGYKFKSASRNFKVKTFQDGVNYFDLVSGLDFMRGRLGVMNPATLRDFDFRILSDAADTMVVEFNCSKPTLLSTGAFCPEKYSGTITIQKSSSVVLESTFSIGLRSLSLLGLSVCPLEGSGPATVSAAIAYSRFSGKYAMSRIEASIEAGDTMLQERVEVQQASSSQPEIVSGKVFYSR